MKILARLSLSVLLFTGSVHVTETQESNTFLESIQVGWTEADAGRKDGSASEEEVQELRATIVQLQAELAKLQQRVETLEKQGVDTQPSAELELEAQEQLRKVMEAYTAGDIERAKVLLEEMDQKYTKTRSYRRAERLSQEIALFGVEAPETLSVEEWFIGNEDSIDLGDGVTILIFWEVWCPHCKREVPSLQETYNKYEASGLDIVGFTKLSRSKTKEEAMEFLQVNGVTYPIAKETGKLSEFFNVSGIPACAVVKDGTVVWRGHPARISDEMIEGWLQ